MTSPTLVGGLPKADLHLHLEGAVPLRTMRELVAKHAPRGRAAAAMRALRSGATATFEDFLSAWRLRATFMREYADFELMAAAVAADLRRRNVVYAEVHVSPYAFMRRYGLELGSLVLAVRRGFDRGGDGAVDVTLIVDLVRHYGIDVGATVLSAAAEVAREARIVAVGLGGIEHACGAEQYTALFRRAAELGLHRVAHAGEHTGPSDVWAVARALNVERIGHGTSAWSDTQLMDHLRDSRITLEVCLSSNRRTGAVRDLSEHPLPRFVRHGIPVALCTDDPALFDTDLDTEYRLARERCALTPDELRASARTAFEVAFMPDERRRRLLDAFDRQWAGRGS